MQIFGIDAVVLLLIALGCSVWYFIGARNHFVYLKNEAKKNRSGVYIEMNNRFEVIPKLVETVKSHTKFESETMTNLVNLRNSFLNLSDTSSKLIKNDKATSQELRNLFAFVAESYPGLQSSQSYVELMRQFGAIQRDLVTAERLCNISATEYNTYREQFPSMVVAFLCGYKKFGLFKLNEASKTVPKFFDQ